MVVLVAVAIAIAVTGVLVYMLWWKKRNRSSEYCEACWRCFFTSTW